MEEEFIAKGLFGSIYRIKILNTPLSVECFQKDNKISTE